MNNDRIITIELYDGYKIYISEDNCSGSMYKGTTIKEILEAVKQYLENNN